jgi:hypothetical protein
MIGKCKHCQKLDFSKCSKTKGSAYIEYNNGKRKWFCNLGCVLLFLSQKKKLGNKVIHDIFHGFVSSGLKQ